MKAFKKQVFNIQQQYKAYRTCIDNLDENEAVVHIDFSKNYNCKLSEVQSHHFGGSRNQGILDLTTTAGIVIFTTKHSNFQDTLGYQNPTHSLQSRCFSAMADASEKVQYDDATYKNPNPYSPFLYLQVVLPE
ncbi:hypothetical protein AVEN_108070-1 [Araneus ventricosus]|uniref:Uncharacterized protein n=1 Tax=Araneus ventricosus TaxID=182803 RepID=A0A4Y2K8U7_ARAVE|nr:hypothetical protein AVEN_108070-1 [Araneus ventricosus]